MYGRCELKWPAYSALLLYLGIAIGAILGLMKGADIIYYFNDIGCKTAAVADDTLNGRLSPTVDNRFFVGLTPLSTDLTSFNSTFNTIWAQTVNVSMFLFSLFRRPIRSIPSREPSSSFSIVSTLVTLTRPTPTPFLQTGSHTPTSPPHSKLCSMGLQRPLPPCLAP
jgi:hypothetical protein